jgi:hypothetical protein
MLQPDSCVDLEKIVEIVRKRSHTDQIQDVYSTIDDVVPTLTSVGGKRIRFSEKLTLQYRSEYEKVKTSCSQIRRIIANPLLNVIGGKMYAYLRYAGLSSANCRSVLCELVRTYHKI